MKGEIVYADEVIAEITRKLHKQNKPLKKEKGMAHSNDTPSSNTAL